MSPTHQNTALFWRDRSSGGDHSALNLKFRGFFWRVERLQVAPVLQEHGVAACPQEGKDPPGPGGAPAIHLPCKAACKALEFLPNPPKASSRGWGARNPAFTVSGEMSQDPEAFIFGLDRPRMAPNGESLQRGRCCRHSWENTHTSRATGLSGCIPESRHVPVSHQALRAPGLEHEGSVWDTAPQLPSSLPQGRGEGRQDPPGPCPTPAVPQVSSGCVWPNEGAGLGWGVSARTSARGGASDHPQGSSS